MCLRLFERAALAGHEIPRDVYYPCVVSLMKSTTLDDDVPAVESDSLGLDFDPTPLGNPVNFVDHRAFVTDFGPEMEALAKIEKILEEGEAFVRQLYVSRSISRAIPMVRGMDDPNRVELNRTTYEALKPVAEQLMQLIDYQDRAIEIFCTNVKQLSAARGTRLVPEGLYTALIRLLDVLQKMDNLKDMKSCLQNDFTRYKRSFGAIRSTIPDGEKIFMEQHKLQMFLANPVFPRQLILFNLRAELKKIDQHEDILLDMLMQAVDFLDRGIYITPDDKYCLLRALPHLLLLVDGDTEEGSGSGGYNVFKQKKVKLDKAKQYFKQFPVLPMYGDMPIRPEVILQRAPHYDVATMGIAWGGGEPDKNTTAFYQLKTHCEWTRADSSVHRRTDNINKRTNERTNERLIE